MKNASPRGRGYDILLEPACQLGYMDRCAGLPYPREYEHFSQKDQWRYETGRLVASVMGCDPALLPSSNVKARRLARLVIDGGHMPSVQVHTHTSR